MGFQQTLTFLFGEAPMLYLDNPQDIAGVTVYPDSQLDYVFYLVPP